MPAHRPSKGCVTITTAIALAFCMRIWMTGVFGLIDIGNMEKDWIQTDALVVGRNSTTFGEDDGEEGRRYWCARVQFSSPFGENVTAISTAGCVLDPFKIIVQSYITIFYNPAYPKEFMEQSILEKELTSLKVMVGVGVAVSLILSGVLCLLLNRQQHRPPGMLISSNEWELPSRPIESPEERKERILSKLHVVTVPEDSSNIEASSIRSMSKLEDSERNEEVGSEETENGQDGDKEKGKDEEVGNSSDCEDEEVGNSSDGDNDDNGKNDTTLEQNESHQHASSTISSFLSDLFLGPSHDQAECVICLGPYEPGEVVCASKSEECNHVFHKECLMDWMMKNNDHCPLCRVNFMKEDGEDEA